MRDRLPRLRLALAVCATVAALALAPAQLAQSCSRAVYEGPNGTLVTTRSNYWIGSQGTHLWMYPRGLERDGAGGPGTLTWTFRYGSIVTTVYGIGTADGLNERGLGVHMLYLKTTDFGPRDPSKPGVHAGLWSQFLLDNAATVEEALAALETVQVVMVETHGHKATVHLAIEDATGDSAIIEFVKGKRVVHHGREHRIMTNDPTYDEQLVLLAKMDVSKPSSEREAVASMLAIARNVSVPFARPARASASIAPSTAPR